MDLAADAAFLGEEWEEFLVTLWVLTHLLNSFQYLDLIKSQIQTVNWIAAHDLDLMIAVLTCLDDVIVNLEDLMHKTTTLLWRHTLQLPLGNLHSSIRCKGRELVVVLLEQDLKAFHSVVCLVQVKLIRAVLARLVEFLEQLFSHLQVWVYIARYSPFWEALVVIFGVCAACSSWKLIGSSWWGWGSCKSRISGSAVLTRYCCSIWLLLASRPWLSLPASSLTTFSSLLFASWQRLPSLLCLLRILLRYLALQILLHPLLDLFLICQHILSPADGSHRL